MQRKEKEPFGIVFKPKEILGIGHAVTVPAGCVKFIFKIVNFYDVKSHLFVKLASLATTINKFLFYLYMFFIIDV